MLTRTDFDQLVDTLKVSLGKKKQKKIIDFLKKEITFLKTFLLGIVRWKKLMFI